MCVISQKYCVTVHLQEPPVSEGKASDRGHRQTTAELWTEVKDNWNTCFEHVSFTPQQLLKPKMKAWGGEGEWENIIF